MNEDITRLSHMMLNAQFPKTEVSPIKRIRLEGLKEASIESTPRYPDSYINFDIEGLDPAIREHARAHINRISDEMKQMLTDEILRGSHDS